MTQSGFASALWTLVRAQSIFGFPRLKKPEPAEPLFFVESIALFYEVDKSVFRLLKVARLSPRWANIR